MSSPPDPGSGDDPITAQHDRQQRLNQNTTGTIDLNDPTSANSTMPAMIQDMQTLGISRAIPMPVSDDERLIDQPSNVPLAAPAMERDCQRPGLYRLAPLIPDLTFGSRDVPSPNDHSSGFDRLPSVGQWLAGRSHRDLMAAFSMEPKSHQPGSVDSPPHIDVPILESSAPLSSNDRSVIASSTIEEWLSDVRTGSQERADQHQGPSSEMPERGERHLLHPVSYPSRPMFPIMDPLTITLTTASYTPALANLPAKIQTAIDRVKHAQQELHQAATFDSNRSLRLAFFEYQNALNVLFATQESDPELHIAMLRDTFRPEPRDPRDIIRRPTDISSMASAVSGSVILPEAKDCPEYVAEEHAAHAQLRQDSNDVDYHLLSSNDDSDFDSSTSSSSSSSSIATKDLGRLYVNEAWREFYEGPRNHSK